MMLSRLFMRLHISYWHLQSDGILVIPTSPSAPPKLQTKVSVLAGFRDKAFTLLSIAGMSGACQVREVLLCLTITQITNVRINVKYPKFQLCIQASIPLGKHDGCPLAVSLIAKNGADRFLLETVASLYPLFQKEAVAYGSTGAPAAKATPRPEAAEAAKEKVFMQALFSYSNNMPLSITCVVFVLSIG